MISFFEVKFNEYILVTTTLPQTVHKSTTEHFLLTAMHSPI